VNKQHIVIVGFMGTGKTTVAHELRLKLNRLVVDLDELIARQHGRSPNEIIIQDGESKFREIENQILGSVLAEEPSRIIAVGGGAWTNAENRKLIAALAAFTVWLDAPFELCWERIKAGSEARPLAPSRETAERLYEERRPVYELADLRIAVTQGESGAEIAMKIANEVLRLNAER
jgi:shikimate kinase